MSTPRVMLEPDDLSPTDEKILDMLREGRVTAPFVADEKDVSLQYARDRLGRMVEHGNARKVYEGLYELVEDPRETADTDTEPVADPVDSPGGFMPPVAALEFEKQGTDKRVMVVEEWLQYVRDDGRVQRTDFEAWYTDEHADRTGHESGGFWDYFIKPAMRQVEGIDQRNSGSYVWVGEE